MSKMNQKETLYGFCGWLSTRKEVAKFGSSEDCAFIVDLIEEFSSANNLDGVTGYYPENLIHPDGECSQNKEEHF